MSAASVESCDRVSVDDSRTQLYFPEHCICSEVTEESAVHTFDSRSTVVSDDHNTSGSMKMPSGSTGVDSEVYASCVRLLNRQLRQTALDEVGNSKYDLVRDDEYLQSCQGYPDLLALQNAILQLQHGLALAQQEIATAVEDSAEAVRASSCWKREYLHMKQTVAALQKENERLHLDKEKLATDKRILKAAYKNLRAEQQALQTQQVESYVISALSSHEQFLLGHKNRSRTTTMDTEGTSTEYECFHGAAFVPGDDQCSPTGSATSCVTPEALVRLSEEKAPHPALRGLGGALAGGLKKFKFPKKSGDVTETTCSSPAPLTTPERALATTSFTEPYAPVRLDCLTPVGNSSRGEKSAVIDTQVLFMAKSSNGTDAFPPATEDPHSYWVEDDLSDPFSLSLPVLSDDPHPDAAAAMERISPITADDPPQPCIHYYTCDPLILRSLSIPVVVPILRSLSIPVVVPYEAQATPL